MNDFLTYSLITVGVLLFVISIIAGDPVECGEPPEWTGGEVASRRAEWTAPLPVDKHGVLTGGVIHAEFQ